MDRDFLQARINKTKLQIEELEDVIFKLSSGAIVNYSIDTGQTKQTVTKASIPGLNRMLESLYNRLNILENRLNGTGVTVGRPCW